MSFLKNDYDIKKLTMMQKLEPRTVDLNPMKIGHVDRVRVNVVTVT